MRNGKWKKIKAESEEENLVSCLGFKSANPISHTENDYVVGIFITKSVRNAHGKAPAHTRAVCVAQISWRIVFLLPKTPDAFWHCFLLFFMIICIHQFCIDSPTPLPAFLSLSLYAKTPGERINTDTHTDRHTYVYRRQWILMSWLDSASCFANSQTASYEFMSYKNSCWDAEMLLPLAGESETRDSSRRGEGNWAEGGRLKCPSFWLLLLLFLCFSHICWFYASLYFNYAPNGW